jgi:hypothetical protein
MVISILYILTILFHKAFLLHYHIKHKKDAYYIIILNIMIYVSNIEFCYVRFVNHMMMMGLSCKVSTLESFFSSFVVAHTTTIMRSFKRINFLLPIPLIIYTTTPLQNPMTRLSNGLSQPLSFSFFFSFLFSICFST